MHRQGTQHFLYESPKYVLLFKHTQIEKSPVSILVQNHLYKNIFTSPEAQVMPGAFAKLETLFAHFPARASTYPVIAVFPVANQDLEQTSSAFEKAVALEPKYAKSIKSKISKYVHRLFENQGSPDNVRDYLIKAVDKYPLLIGFDD